MTRAYLLASDHFKPPSKWFAIPDPKPPDTPRNLAASVRDDELRDDWTQLMDHSGAMPFERNTHELMEGHWPAVARDEKAPRATRE